jgi:hypothetical protein
MIPHPGLNRRTSPDTAGHEFDLRFREISAPGDLVNALPADSKHPGDLAHTNQVS